MTAPAHPDTVVPDGAVDITTDPLAEDTVPASAVAPKKTPPTKAITPLDRNQIVNPFAPKHSKVTP